MAFRYRQITPQTGDFINPDDWNVNVREFTNEFNGHLDRDNLPEKGITTASIKADAFHQVHSVSSGADFEIESDQTRFIQLQILEFETQHQGILMCDWSGYWEFETIQLDLQSGIDVQTLDIRLMINGSEVSRIRTETNLKRTSSGYMVGALPVEAGMVRIIVEVKTTARKAPINTGSGFDPLITGPSAGSVTIKNKELVAILRKA
jgi:hypothetical protein|tara:strand:+ start:5034 stop:5651 length:618 start_codon:yes stop_codon:yes gene_type:complete